MIIVSTLCVRGVVAPARGRHRCAALDVFRHVILVGALGVVTIAVPRGDTAAQTANQPPVAATTGPYASASLGLYLDGSPSHDPDGDALTYAWDFGDGTTGKYYRVWKSYASRGSYTVTLVVTDSRGAQSARVTTTVTIHNAPTAVAGGPYPAAEGAPLQLDGRGSSDADGDALTYAWAFGDGSTGTGAQPTHVYAQSGTYTVTLTVTDARGATGRSQGRAWISNRAPTVSASLGASSVAAGSPVTLTGSFTDPSAVDGPWPYTVVWGDGSANTTGQASSVGATITATHAYATAGSYTIALEVRDKDGGQGTAQRTLSVTETPAPPPPTAATVVLLAGDIADCGRDEDELTASILDRHPDATILTLGDNVYPTGTLATFNACYGPSWGRHLARTWPAVGNHEYTTEMPNAEGYHAYFGARAGPLGQAYYTTTLGDWQIVVLNSELSMKAGSPQEVWLRAELAKSTRPCTLAIWHKPRFYSGTLATERTTHKAAWAALYAAGAELVFSGHEHYYERFAPQNAEGVADPARGIRQFIVGTGGKNAASFGTPAPNSEVRESAAFGVLKLTLESNSYSWEFLPAEQTSFTDSGTGTCH